MGTTKALSFYARRRRAPKALCSVYIISNFSLSRRWGELLQGGLHPPCTPCFTKPKDGGGMLKAAGVYSLRGSESKGNSPLQEYTPVARVMQRKLEA